MTPRDVLREWAEHAETHIGPDCADSRALRELDRWIVDAVQFLDTLAPSAYPIWQKLRERAAQAGYGEK